MLRVVVQNLAENALRYAGVGATARLSVARRPEGVVLTVADDGAGVDEADLPRLFERFYRASNVAGRIAGSGIGLAGVRQIVEQHGGTIQVESRERIGSTFTVRLPLG